MPLDQTEATRLAEAMMGKTPAGATPAPTTPIMLRLMSTASGSPTTPGVEVVNSGNATYAPQDITAATPASATEGAFANNTAITFTNMPEITTVGVEGWDSGGPPRRLFYGTLAVSKQTAEGDSLTFANGALRITMA